MLTNLFSFRLAAYSYPRLSNALRGSTSRRRRQRAGEIYLQGEIAMTRVALRAAERKFHLFCSPFNAGAEELAQELQDTPNRPHLGGDA